MPDNDAYREKGGDRLECGHRVAPGVFSCPRCHPAPLLDGEALAAAEDAARAALASIQLKGLR